MSIRNRRAGHTYERQLAEEYRELGYLDCTTSRYSSRKKDDWGIDLDCTIPFCVQAKYYKNQPNFSEVIDDMRVLPDEIKLVHFKRNKGKGQKKDELVILKKEDWYTIVKWLKEAKIV
jgi:hypothetical protein